MRCACLELRVQWASDTTASVRAYLDDGELTDLFDGSPTIDSPPLSVGIFGLYFDSSNGSPYGIWLDELMIATQPIGCAK